MATFGADQIGRVLGGRYRLVAPVGSGSSATVFLAEDAQLRRQVAVKTLHPMLAEDQGFLKRFRAEAQAAASLSHPNLVQVFDWGEDAGLPYLVTEYLAGGSLRAMLDRGRRLSPSQALVVGRAAARGLDYAHRRGFVHRDIKPANLLFGEDARLRVGDFGLARAVAEAAWTEPAGVVLGTARYASPEQARGLAVDGKTDVYSLTLSLVEAVTGQVPFAADTTVATLMNRLDKLMPVSADLGALAPVLERAGRPDPAERYDAGEFGRALVQAAERLPRPQPLVLVSTIPGQRPDDTELGARSMPPPVSLAAAASSADTAFDPRSWPSAAGSPESTGAPVEAPAGSSGPAGPPAQPPPAGAAPLGWTPAPRRAGAAEMAADSTQVVPTSPPPDQGPQPPTHRPRKRRRRVIVTLLVVLLVIASAVAGFVMLQRAATKSYPVPTVVGLDEAAALNVISPNGWTPEIVRERSDAAAVGKVFRQEPVTGELERGSLFRMWVATGPTLSPLPAVAGLTREAAEAAVIGQGLRPNIVGEQFDENGPKNTVLLWAVEGKALPPGTMVEKGTVVDLLLSSGPAPRTVPKTAGQDAASAQAEIEKLGLVVQRADDVFSDKVAAGKVVATTPKAGEQVARGSTVVITVSKGPDVVTVPLVLGMALPDAATAIQGAGLAVGDIAGPDAGKVVAADPKGGSVVKRGTTVNLLLG